jgi:hypothetical protein
LQVVVVEVDRRVVVFRHVKMEVEVEGMWVLEVKPHRQMDMIKQALVAHKLLVDARLHMQVSPLDHNFKEV